MIEFQPAMKMARHFFLLLFFGICFISAVSPFVFKSFDCGSSANSYTDNSSIIWSGDSTYVSNGVSRSVQTGNSISRVLDTLRVFTTRKKNCYSAFAGRGSKILARASFYYGNYDQKSLPPSFDLLFDGNRWTTVEATVDSVVSYEVIYVAKGDYTSVCVAQTKPGQFPFVNAVEFRSLDAAMYELVDENRALFLRRRLAYGTNKTIRYSDDFYDRIWEPAVARNGLIVTNTDSWVFGSDREDKPPGEMLQNAITTSNVSDGIKLGTVFPEAEDSIYMNLYFSEVAELGSSQKRSFTLYKNDESLSNPISPPFDDFVEVNYVSNTTVPVNTTFYLMADSDSTLPPLINGLEVFSISDPLTDGTNSKDVEGLSKLQNRYEILQEWSGDPCLPAPYSWEWVNCSNDATPRITALYLSSFGLSGFLPDISSMDSLETIDLHNNSLAGLIPDFLGLLPNLKQLNLADNLFTGPVPASLSRKKNLNLVVTGNPGMCNAGKSCQSSGDGDWPMSGDDPADRSSGKKKSSSKLPLILGITIPAGILIWLLICVFLILYFKKKSAANNAVQNGADAEATGNVGMGVLKTHVGSGQVDTSSEITNTFGSTHNSNS